MANKDTHDMVGFGSGVVAAFLSARGQGRDPSIWELLGGAFGGWVCSRVPDALEPAIHPHHRQFAHSLAVLVGGGHVAIAAARNAQATLARAAEREPDPILRTLVQLASGITIGAPTGYASHLVADATTPRGIPFLGRIGGGK